MSKHQKLNEEHQATMAGLSNPDRYTFVDLGLPSGRLWATENAPGFYTFDEAVDTFGELLPKGSAMVELIEESEVSWNREKKGLDITGPNGNTIFLPADGYRWEMEVNNVKLEGDYWTRMLYSQPTPAAWASAVAASVRWTATAAPTASLCARAENYN